MLILGLPYFGKALARSLADRGWRAAFATHPGSNPAGWAALLARLARADILYLIGSRAEVGSPQDRLLRIRHRPTVIHWVGTDLQIAAEEEAKAPLARSVINRPTHWCDAPWLVDELSAVGGTGAYVPLPVAGLADEAPPLPKRFRVLLYYPVDTYDREVFDFETLWKLPTEFPGVGFTLIPSPAETLPAPRPRNLEARSWVSDMDALYRETTVYIRLTNHDGTSHMVLEALSRGRYVIWTHPLPGATLANDFDEVSGALRGLIERHQAGTLGLNEAGIATSRSDFDPHAAIVNIDRRLRAILREYRRR